VHRLGAVVAAVVLGLLAWRALRRGQSRAVRTSAACLALLLALQLTVGPTMVLKALPLWLATAHNAIAAMLVLATVALTRFLWTPKGLR
jgi:heme A synthase